MDYRHILLWQLNFSCTWHLVCLFVASSAVAIFNNCYVGLSEKQTNVGASLCKELLMKLKINVLVYSFFWPRSRVNLTSKCQFCRVTLPGAWTPKLWIIIPWIDAIQSMIQVSLTQIFTQSWKDQNNYTEPEELCRYFRAIQKLFLYNFCQGWIDWLQWKLAPVIFLAFLRFCSRLAIWTGMPLLILDRFVYRLCLQVCRIWVIFLQVCRVC